jgi:hypothetical protein
MGADKVHSGGVAVKNNRGLLFTVATVLLILIVLSVVALSYLQWRSHASTTVYTVRCDELNIMLDDLEKDLERASSISGSRAMLVATNMVLTNGTEHSNADQKIEEMVLNGSYNGEDVELLYNQTLEEWVKRIIPVIEQRKFNTNLNETLLEVDVAPYNSFNFVVMTRINNLTIEDEYGYCSFDGTLPRRASWLFPLVSVENLDDPLYPIKTYGYAERTIVEHNISTESHGDPAAVLADLDYKYFHATKDGPSIFERLEGLLGSPADQARHDYYVDLAYNAKLAQGLNISKSNITIGLESFVNTAELYSELPEEIWLQVIQENQSSVDAVYFGSFVGGHKMTGVSSTYPWFRIDDGHAAVYGINQSQLYD